MRDPDAPAPPELTTRLNWREDIAIRTRKRQRFAATIARVLEENPTLTGVALWLKIGEANTEALTGQDQQIWIEETRRLVP